MSKKKFGHKLGGSFASLLTHTRKSPAWQRRSVGARALFMELQSLITRIGRAMCFSRQEMAQSSLERARTISVAGSMSLNTTASW